MSSRNYETQILDSIQMIVDNAISKASFDKTIKAIVSEVSNAAEGRYVVSYQGNSMVVYSSNPETRYTKGTEVYVLVPGNDMQQKKTIIGAVDNLGLDYSSLIEGDAGYEVVGSNIVNSDKVFELCSYIPKMEKTLYDRDNNINLINFNTQSFDIYTKQSSYLICGATFQTALPQEQQIQGEYGIAFEIECQNENETIIQNYIVDTGDMIGTPYNLLTETRQYAIFKIDNQKALSVKRIYIFEYGFPNSADAEKNDIYISKIELKAANEINKESLSSTMLTLIAKEGTYFDETYLDTESLSIEAQVKIKGRFLGEAANVKYYWFKENNQITNEHPLYNRIGGAGWECLNDYNPYYNNNQNVEWVPGSKIFTTVKNQNIARETKYKCIAIYNDISVEKEFIITNFDSNYEIIIKSDEGVQFYYDNGKPNLTCFINNEECNTDEYLYIWSKTDNNGRFTILNETEIENSTYNNAVAEKNRLLEELAAETKLTGSTQEQLNQCNTIIESYENITRIEKNKIYNINLKEITDYAIYKCSVFKSGALLGVATIRISNDMTTTMSYDLIIHNGNQVFKYNEFGIAPNSESATNPIEILPLSFTLYDKDGKEIDKSLINIENISWTVPSQHTFIEESDFYDIKQETNDFIEYYKTRTFDFNIRPVYLATHKNNDIQLTIVYNNNTITAKTNFTFIKTGEVGTNGTEYICKVIPNTLDGSKFTNYPIITYDEFNNTTTLNYRTANDNKWFRIQFWKNGELIYSGTESGYTEEGQAINLEWSILANQYGEDVQDDSNFTINKSTGAMSVNRDVYSNPANIVKCKITYGMSEYFAVMPIIFVRVANEKYQIALENKTGFQEVMYSANGTNPIYNEAQPFTIQVLENIDNIWEDVSILEQDYSVNYEWTVKGQVYYSYWQSELNLIEKILYASREQKNQKYFEPINTYNGLCVTNAIECKISREDTEIGTIHIPVYFYLNRYGNSAINGWDGNSISIDENNSGMILAPQVGAGKKNADNSFTGIFMGSVKEQGAPKEEHGLFGYNAGQRTIALNAEDGSARFGATGKGQIVIDPSTGNAMIESGNFNTEAGTGMRIDLSEPSIEFGSGNFKVDKHGRLTAKGFSTIDYVNQKAEDTLKEVEGMLDQSPLKVELSTSNIFIPCNDDNTPVHAATYNVDFSGTFEGEPIPNGLVEVLYKENGFPQRVNNIEISLTSTSEKQQLHFSVEDVGIIDEIAIPTNSSFTFDFIYLDNSGGTPQTYTIPKTIAITVLPPGAPGKSAYDIWLDQGNEGTEQDYLNSLKGDDGVVMPLETEKGFNSKDLTQSIQLFDSGENTLPYLKIYGNTVQNTVLGNNLCPDLSTSNKNGIWNQGSYDYTVIEPLSDGWVRFSYDNSANTSSRTCFANLRGYKTGWEINQTYLFVVETRNVNNPGNTNFYPHVVTTSNTSYNIFTTGFGSISAADLKSKNIFMKELPTNTKKTWDYAKCMSQFTVPAGQTFSIEVRYSWLKEYEGINETNFVYEKYQCISPSLDNPSKINSLGYTNEFDEEAWAKTMGVTPSEYTEDGYPLYSFTYYTAAKAGRILEGYFKENTSYYFSMVGREDAYIWGSNPHTWGFKFVYTDGTEKILYVPDGSYLTGEIESAYTTTDPNKTIAYITAHNWGDFANTKTTVGKIFLRESAAEPVSYIPHGQYAIDIKSFGKNLINLDTLIPDTYINGTTGEETPYTGYVCSPFIEITSFKTLYLSNNGRGMVSFYDKDKKYLGTSINGNLRTDGDRWSTTYYWVSTVPIPFDQYPTIKYFRVSYYDKTTEATSLRDLRASEQYYTKFGVTSELTLDGGKVVNNWSQYKKYSTIRLREQLKAHKYNQTRDEMTIENGLPQIINKTRLKTFTGEEDWTLYQETDNYIAFGWDTQNESFSFNEKTMVCSHFQFMKEWDYEVSFVEEENFWYDYDYANGTEFIGFKILKTRLEEPTLESFKDWLSKQEITFTVINNETYLSEDACVIPTYKNNTILKISSLEVPAQEASGTYYTIYKGNQGDSMICKIIASSQFFKSTDGPGGLFSPSEIYLFPELYGVSFSRWEYSIDSVNWEIAVSGEHGIEIGPHGGKDNVLKLASDSDLYTREDTTVSFRCITNYPTVYDSVTIAKMYDVTDLSVGGRNFILKSHIFDDLKEWGQETVQSKDENGQVIKTWYLTEVYENGVLVSDGKIASGLKAVLYEDTAGEQAIQINASENNNGRVHWIHSNTADVYLQDGDQFVFSCEIRSTGATNNLAPLFHYHGTVGYLPMDGEVTSEPSRITCSGIWKKVDGYNTDFRFDFTGMEGTYYLTKFKLEKGKNPTDWTLAPEDLETIAELEYCIGSSSSIPPAEDHPSWGSQTLFSPNIQDGDYLWSRIKNISTSGLITYNSYSCLMLYQKELKSQRTEYLLCDIIDENVILQHKDDEGWTTTKPTDFLKVGSTVVASKLWSRLHSKYVAFVEGIMQEVDIYTNYTLDTAWEKSLFVESELTEKIENILLNTNEGFVRIEGGNIVVGNDASDPTHLIIMNHYGISFMDRTGKTGWPTPGEIETATNTKTAWTIDGSLDMNFIRTEELEATYIRNENLILGNKDNRVINDKFETVDAGDLDIYDKDGHLIFETVTSAKTGSSDTAVWIEGFKIHRYIVSEDWTSWSKVGYIYLSAENGFGEFDINNKQIFGNQNGVWYARVAETEKQIIATKDSNDIKYGIQMIPMSFTEDGIPHKGLAFLKVDAE